MHQVNEKIRLLRLFFGYSQQNMADDCGISQRTISKIERGEMKDFQKHLPGIARVFRLEPTELQHKPLDELLKKLSNPPPPRIPTMKASKSMSFEAKFS
ncbi:MAG: helix-turn-helix transcriptional regulator [Saprospiraceae bacterium]|nr:helix-turn-helix transcriptional regulator [Saprospiraceae bacterium]